MLNFNQYMGLERIIFTKDDKRISDFQPAQKCTETCLFQFGIASSPKKIFKFKSVE